MRKVEKRWRIAGKMWVLLLLVQSVVVSMAALAGEQTFTRTGKYKYSESESRTSMKLHVKEIIIQEVLQTEVGGYSQSVLNLEKQESAAGGGVRSSSTQSITQILAGVIKRYFVVKEWNDEMYFYTTAEVTVDMDATKRKLDEIAAERKKEEQEKSEITRGRQEALEQKNAALEAQNKLLQQQAAINAQVKTLAEAQAKLDGDRIKTEESIALQQKLNAEAKALADRQASLNAEARVLAEQLAKLGVAPSALPLAAPAPQAGAPANFAYIRGGVFTMGSPPNEVSRRADEGPQHQVRLSDFYMCKYEVTVGEFRQFIKESKYRTEAEKANNLWTWRQLSSSEENHPVISVSWNDAIEYCKWLSVKTGKSYRLPTEAEWEYACRAGTTTPFNTGDNITTSQANYNGNFPYNNNQKGVDRDYTVPVNSFAPNAWGLYNMHGNVWEWCSDWYDSGYYAACKENGVVENPSGLEIGSPRIPHVIRGGSWLSDAGSCRSAYRSGERHPFLRLNNGGVGFRLVFVP